MLCRDLIIFSGGSFGEKDRAFTAYDPVSMKNYYGLKHHPTFDLKYRIDFYQLITLNKNEVYFIGGITSNIKSSVVTLISSLSTKFSMVTASI
jgi:hypothetical protein